MASIFRATDLRTGAPSPSRFRIPKWKPIRFCSTAFKREEEIGKKLDHPA